MKLIVNTSSNLAIELYIQFISAATLAYTGKKQRSAVTDKFSKYCNNRQ